MRVLLAAILSGVVLLGVAGVAQAGSVRGTVRNLATGKPVVGAYVRVVGGEGGAFTGANGRFVLEVEAETVTLGVTGAGFVELILKAVPVDGRHRDIELVPDSGAPLDLGAEEITVRAGREKVDKTPAVSAHRIERGAVEKTPGSLEDVTRALALKTGIVPVGEFAPVLYVRGGDVYQTYFFLDDVLIFQPFQPVGGGTIFNPDLTESAELFTGGQYASYAEALSGIISIQYKQPETDRLHAYLDVSVISANARVDGPLSRNWSGLLSLRRSNYEPVLAVYRAVSSTDDDIASPSFLNGFAKAVWRPSGVDTLSFNVMGIENSLVNFSFDDEERNVSNDVFFRDRQGLAWIEYKRLIGETAAFRGNISTVTDRLEAESTGTDPLGIDVETTTRSLRGDLTVDPSPQFGWEVGGFFTNVRFELLGKVGDLRQLQPTVAFGGDPNVPLVEIFPASSFYATAVYGQFRADLARATIQPGLRLSYNTATDELNIGPRVNVSYSLGENSALKAAFGLFNQPPYNPIFLDESFGNPNLKTERALHYVLGYEGALPGGLWLKTETFYKQIFNQVMPQDFTTVDPDNPTPEDLEKFRTPFDNVGETTAWGAEVALKRQIAGRFRVEVNYSLLRVLTRNPLIEDPINREFPPYQDQRHTMNLVANYRLRDWTFSATYRFGTGKPYTPVLGWEEQIDVSSDVGPRRIWVPVDFAPFNSERYPLYSRLDVRAERSWKWRRWRFTGYVEVLSAQVRRNTEFIAYTAGDPDGNPPVPPVRKDVLGIPTVPYIGVRGEF